MGGQQSVPLGGIVLQNHLVLNKVLSYLDKETLLNCALVNTQWRNEAETLICERVQITLQDRRDLAHYLTEIYYGGRRYQRVTIYTSAILDYLRKGGKSSTLRKLKIQEVLKNVAPFVRVASISLQKIGTPVNQDTDPIIPLLKLLSHFANMTHLTITREEGDNDFDTDIKFIRCPSHGVIFPSLESLEVETRFSGGDGLLTEEEPVLKRFVKYIVSHSPKMDKVIGCDVQAFLLAYQILEKERIKGKRVPCLAASAWPNMVESLRENNICLQGMLCTVSPGSNYAIEQLLNNFSESLLAVSVTSRVPFGGKGTKLQLPPLPLLTKLGLIAEDGFLPASLSFPKVVDGNCAMAYPNLSCLEFTVAKIQQLQSIFENFEKWCPKAMPQINEVNFGKLTVREIHDQHPALMQRIEKYFHNAKISDSSN